MLSKSLIRFSVDGRGCVPTLVFDLRQNKVGVMKIMVTSFKRSCAHSVAFSTFDPAAGHCLPKPLPATPGQLQGSLGQSPVRSLFLSPGSWCAKVLFVCSKSLFPHSCGSSVIKSHWPPKSNSLGISVHLPDPQVGKSIVGPRTFLTVQELIWYNCSAVCGSSAEWLYHEVNGDLLQEGLCHMLCDPNQLYPEPLPLQKATADPCLYRRYSNTQRQIWLSLCGGL